MSGRSPRWFTGIQYPYEADFVFNTWEQIIEACQKKKIPSTWKVGDQKSMEINGMGYVIDIIGINHDTYTAGGTAPLTFQLHDCYGETKNMNSSDTNRGGWKNSAMRTTHLPAILALMPTEVRSGIREVSKKASVGGRSTTIEAVSDKLFLLSEVEIFGSVEFSKSGEGTQYDYYKALNRKAKKLNGSARSWWGRSPYGDSSYDFCRVDGKGGAIYNSASGALGVAFAFCF